jgi:oligopeptide/dipeptide ABC transporter ATP-binding protein
VTPCLSCSNLHVTFTQHEGISRAVNGVSFDIPQGKTLGVVGESGCGKSVTALSIMRLIPQPAGRITAGSILYDGKDLLTLSEDAMRSIRGNSISMVFQDPMTSLNPVFTCGYQIAEVIRLHQKVSAKEAHERVLTILDRVGIRHVKDIAVSYPHQLSGGMLQRIMIAIALSCTPHVLIADEPTTALDVTVQAKILDLLTSIQDSMGMSMMMITHDLGIIADIAHEIIVMYAGEIVEHATTRELFDRPLHPYTQGLLATVPSLDAPLKRLQVIPGEVPNPMHIPQGCPFHPRCPQCMPRCLTEHPETFMQPNEHSVRCFLYV